MLLEEAARINSTELAPLLVGKKIEWQEAFWLGIEALKRLKNAREGSKSIVRLLLPGETEK